MRKCAFAALLVVGGFLLAPGRVDAIKNGTLDGNGHPHVGLMVAQDASGAPLWRCSGTLMSPTVFITAGHCTDGADRVEIWFAADVQSGIPGNGYPFTGDVGGTPYTHPQYDPVLFFLYDLGVVVLDAPVTPSTYGVLPALNALDAMAFARGLKNRTFTSVGYGLQQSFPDAASFLESALRIRMVSTPQLVQINTPFTGLDSLLLSNNTATGGICFGDSGGPNFVGSSNVVGAVTSFVLNQICAGTGGTYRVDRKDDQDWLVTFGITPP